MSVGQAIRGGFPRLGQVSLVSVRFPLSWPGFPGLDRVDRISVSPIPLQKVVFNLSLYILY